MNSCLFRIIKNNLRGNLLAITFVPIKHSPLTMNTSTLKKLMFCLMLISSVTVWAQDKGKISGTVTLSGNTPAENISVVLKGTLLSSVTNQQGQYEIKNVKPGTYVIKVSAIGIKAIEENITIAAGEIITKDFMLSESQEQLNEVVINGNANKFARTKSEVVSKMPLKDIENPQVYTLSLRRF